MLIILTILFAEIPFAIKANQSYIQPISIVVTDKFQEETINNLLTKTEYKEIKIINMDNNDELGSRKIFYTGETGKKMVENWTSVTGKEIYYNYFPFFIFSEEYRYIRK